jgi:subtilisin family serine protease
MIEPQSRVEAEKRLAISLVVALLLTTMLLLFAPASRGAQALPPREAPAADGQAAYPFTQTLVIGGQRIDYAGTGPLSVESGAYWNTPPAGAQAIVAVDSDGPHLHLVPGPGDEVRLIVQLEGAPLAVDLSGLGDLAGLEQRIAGLRAAQAGVLRDLAAQGIAVRVQHRYVHVFNGLAVIVRAGDRAAIARTAGVRAVYPDYALQPLLPQSVPLVGAPAVWAMHDAGGQPALGTGVRVAVVDTGIDYDHPDLGGPGFPNTRVITGYNFVSDTVDPWDDMGHGTHVAGIVGANGQITGVAPAASLMAYKVVDAQLGYAQTSDTIAAVERALDPDGDPGTADGAQVINISLGGPGTPDDPLSQACDNAAAAGVVVVVGAGNGGPNYQSLTSPGLADRAISVGATSKTDGLWVYSSRGPVPASWAIKPDLVAPGVSISSTFPGGGYVYGTGTSASTPHVAGAAALLRQLHPAWPPDWVRAALMNTAKDLGRSPFEQGAGRLQVDQAAATPALLLPPSLSLGRVDGAQPLWSRQERLTLYNVSTATVTYTLSIAGSFPAGVTLAVSPTQVAVLPGSSASLTFTLAVSTALVPDCPADPFAYWGALRAIAANPSAPALRVPFAFVKAPLLRLHVDEVPVSVMFIHDEPLTSRYAWPPTTTSDHLLPSAAYSVVVQYQQPYAYVVQAATLSDSGFVELTVPRSAAIHQARIAFTDETGEVATPNHALHRFMWGGNGWLVSELAGSEPITEVMRFSDVPPQFTWERTAADADPADDAYRQWHGRAEGISGDLVFLTAPVDFARIDHPLRPLPGAGAYTFQEMIGYETPSYALTFGPAAPAVALPYTRPAYYRSPPPGHELYALRLAIPDPAPADWEGTLMSPWLQLDAERHLLWRQPFSPEPFYWRVPAGGVEPLGLGPAHCFARFENDAPETIRLVAAVGRSLFYRAYQGGDVSWEMRQPYELRQGGALVQVGDIGLSTGGSQALITLPASGTYSLTLPFTYTLGSTEPVTGHGRVIAEFDTRRYASDADPPFVKVLRLLQNGAPADVVSGPVELRLVVSDTVDAAPVVSVAYDVGAGWVPVQVSDEYTAALPLFEAGADPKLRIVASDASGNVLTHYLEPAYLVRWRRAYLPLVLKR